MAESRPAHRLERTRSWELAPAEPITNLAAEMLANRNLLAALAGPAIALTLDIEGGALPVQLSAEDLTRVLVNLVKNAAEAMPGGGRIQLALREQPAEAGTSAGLALTIEDNGPGIAPEALERVFESGYTTRSQGEAANGGRPAGHRGLGLAISRAIVESAGGRMQAANRPTGGARFTLELPLRKL
jgi:signal transduction histidine kinase